MTKSHCYSSSYFIESAHICMREHGTCMGEVNLHIMSACHRTWQLDQVKARLQVYSLPGRVFWIPPRISEQVSCSRKSLIFTTKVLILSSMKHDLKPIIALNGNIDVKKWTAQNALYADLHPLHWPLVPHSSWHAGAFISRYGDNRHADHSGFWAVEIGNYLLYCICEMRQLTVVLEGKRSWVAVGKWSYCTVIPRNCNCRHVMYRLVVYAPKNTIKEWLLTVWLYSLLFSHCIF